VVEEQEGEVEEVEEQVVEEEEVVLVEEEVVPRRMCIPRSLRAQRSAHRRSRAAEPSR
jgi:hypothetical protein